METEEPILARNPYDEPGRPGKPTVIDYDVNSVTLQWTKPEADGGRPVTHYIIEAKDRLSVEWKEIHVTKNSDEKAKIDGFKEGEVFYLQS